MRPAAYNAAFKLAGWSDSQMDIDTAAGCAIIAASLILMTSLVLWSRWAIERIARRGPTSARRIIKDLDRGR